MSYPYFDNFILDGLVLLLGIGFVVLFFTGMYYVGAICYAIIRGLVSKLTRAKKESDQETQVLFFGKEPKKPNDYE